tara:strand:- start:403 stop:1752 length:1350 start_codon:yes stop_codon:yes gene_type:complete
MSELPRGWTTAPIKDVVAINPKHDPETDRHVEVSFVPMPSVDEHCGAITAPQVKPLSDVWKGFTHFAEGDVIFAKITPCMENGKTAIARNLANGLACGSTEFHVLRPTEAISAEYIWRYLRQKSFRAEAEAAMTGAVGQRRVPKPFLEERELPLPPLPEQRRIVAKLDRLSARSAAARDHLARTTKLATRAKQAILSAAVSGELTRTWRESRPDLDPWRHCTLGEVASGFNYGSAAKSAKEGDVPVLRMGNIQDGKLDWSDLVFTSDVAEISKYELHSGDVLFNRTNSPALVGKTTVYRGERPAIFAGYLIRVVCGTEVLPDFVNACLNSGIGRDYCWQVKTDGVSQSNINAQKLKAFPISLPSVEEQREIIRRVATAFTRIENLTEEATRAAHLLDRLDERLLAKAFRGELVPQDPDDEPAEALLARIREARAAAPKAKRGRKKKAEA